MGFYQRRVLPRLIDFALNNRIVNEERRKCLDGVRGRVVELGFGSGLNLRFYPATVERLVAIDPSEDAAKIARKRISSCPFPVEYHASSGERIEAEDESFDSAVTTFTLCTIPNVAAALSELRRVLKRGSHFFFLEHGRAVDAKVAHRQQRWEPVQRRIGGGCHLTRKIDELIADAGFEIRSLESYYVRGPKIVSFFYRGVAARPAVTGAGAAALG